MGGGLLAAQTCRLTRIARSRLRPQKSAFLCSAKCVDAGGNEQAFQHWCAPLRNPRAASLAAQRDSLGPDALASACDRGELHAVLRHRSSAD